MNHEVILGNDGSVWLLADLWRCRDGGDITGLVRHDDWSSSEHDWMSDTFNERIGRERCYQPTERRLSRVRVVDICVNL